MALHVTDPAEHLAADGAGGLAQVGADVQRARFFGREVTGTHVADEAAAVVVIVVALVHHLLVLTVPLTCAFHWVDY